MRRMYKSTVGGMMVATATVLRPTYLYREQESITMSGQRIRRNRTF